jgi:hypothetical protein
MKPALEALERFGFIILLIAMQAGLLGSIIQARTLGLTILTVAIRLRNAKTNL